MPKKRKIKVFGALRYDRRKIQVGKLNQYNCHGKMYIFSKTKPSKQALHEHYKYWDVTYYNLKCWVCPNTVYIIVRNKK